MSRRFFRTVFSGCALVTCLGCAGPPAEPPALVRAGQALLGPGIPLDSPVTGPALPLDQRRPAGAWGNGTWLVAWEDQRSGGNASDIYATRVSAAGAILDP